jgi:hypothetical protein
MASLLSIDTDLTVVLDTAVIAVHSFVVDSSQVHRRVIVLHYTAVVVLYLCGVDLVMIVARDDVSVHYVDVEHYVPNDRQVQVDAELDRHDCALFRHHHIAYDVRLVLIRLVQVR